jgi:hypothetical protein
MSRCSYIPESFHPHPKGMQMDASHGPSWHTCHPVVIQNIARFVPRTRFFDVLLGYIPSGKRLHNYGQSPLLMWKSTISIAMANSYVKLPGGSQLSRLILNSIFFGGAWHWLENHTPTAQCRWVIIPFDPLMKRLLSPLVIGDSVIHPFRLVNLVGVDVNFQSSVGTWCWAPNMFETWALAMKRRVPLGIPNPSDFVHVPHGFWSWPSDSLGMYFRDLPAMYFPFWAIPKYPKLSPP